MLSSLPPDAFQIHHATYRLMLDCPFCGAPAGPPLDYVNKRPMRGTPPVYQTLICCTNDTTCGASVRCNADSRSDAQATAVERWQRRVDA